MDPTNRGRTTVYVRKYRIYSLPNVSSWSWQYQSLIRNFWVIFPSISNISESCAGRCVASCLGSVKFVATKSTFIQIHKTCVGRRYYSPAVEKSNCKPIDSPSRILLSLETLSRSMHSTCKKLPMQ